MPHAACRCQFDEKNKHTSTKAPLKGEMRTEHIAVNMQPQLADLCLISNSIAAWAGVKDVNSGVVGWVGVQDCT